MPKKKEALFEAGEFFPRDEPTCLSRSLPGGSVRVLFIVRLGFGGGDGFRGRRRGFGIIRTRGIVAPETLGVRLGFKPRREFDAALLEELFLHHLDVGRGGFLVLVNPRVLRLAPLPLLIQPAAPDPNAPWFVLAGSPLHPGILSQLPADHASCQCLLIALGRDSFDPIVEMNNARIGAILVPTGDGA